MSEKNLTLGSLFDGSGGFPLAGILSGITPVWGAEIELFPIRVTTKRLPFMKHYGDVSALNGAELEPVDIITWGSPCQDLSIAGSREGLGGERSGLFFEAVRIVKEMRCATNGKYPKYVLWENVPGAFSSNDGEDFRQVIQSICSIKEDKVYVPRPEKWTGAGEVMADNYSVAWRVLDAQYWGVPQRRRRIFLVGDLTGQCAGKILFESEGLSLYSKDSFNIWKGIARNADPCITEAGRLNQCAGFSPGNGPKAWSIGFENEKAPTLRRSGVPAAVYENHKHAAAYSSSKASYHTRVSKELANALVASDSYDPPAVYNIEKDAFSRGENAKSDPSASEESQPAITTSEPGADQDEYTARRLTPTECARLQGFPDWWCADLGTENPTEDELAFWHEVFETHRKLIGKASRPKTDKQIIRWLKDPHTDSAEYKMWGNGIALPCAMFVLSGIVYYSRSTQ